MSCPIVVRFPPDLEAAARQAAEADGMSVSAWVRRLVQLEKRRRDGVCPTCGQKPEVPGA